MTKARVLMAVATCFIAGGAFAHGDMPREAKGIDHEKAEERVFGRPGDPKKVSRTIRVEMSDRMRFFPEAIRVKRGETVRFVVVNANRLMHEMVLGTMQELKEHYELMKKFPGMEHDEAHMAHVAPGKTETIVWQFTKPGEFYYGCLLPGHFEAGMVGNIVVR